MHPTHIEDHCHGYGGASSGPDAKDEKKKNVGRIQEGIDDLLGIRKDSGLCEIQEGIVCLCVRPGRIGTYGGLRKQPHTCGGGSMYALICPAQIAAYLILSYAGLLWSECAARVDQLVEERLPRASDTSGVHY